ncbi:MAG TPA: peptidoglycan editing factor PgeF [Bacteroidia bacterium]|nr:peptidoglycan editing factor PgeF [Bacteroidia bacterium]
MFLTSEIISTPHAFFTRKGGVSPAPFASLNFGGSDDDPKNISENRRRGLLAAGMNPENVARLNQVHGNVVCIAKNGSQTGDALVTNEKGLTLAIGAADCYPLLFHDAKNKIIGAAHAGWKGTLSRIAKNTIEAMEKLGAEREFIHVAIGPGISGKNYEVSEEVIQKFRDAGFPGSCWEGRHLDLLETNKFILRENKIAEENTWALGRCTTEDDFFSYRRDKGITGRMWACIML